MINFPCQCGYPFSVPQQLAGSDIQCPSCGLLASVPPLSDLAAMEADGTYKVDQPETAPDHHIGGIARVFQSPDPDEEVDLRPTFQEMRDAGVDEAPLELRGEVRPGAPKYDPETGELIRPLPMKPVPVEPIPVAAKAITYASGERLIQPPGLAVLRLLTFPNVLVMFFILVAELFGHALSRTLVILSLLSLPVFMIVMAHYANVVDDIGREGIDELPRPLRDLEWGDDVFNPFFRTLVSVILCFWPVMFFNPGVVLRRNLGWVIAGAIPHSDPSATHLFGFVLSVLFFLAGTFIFPAVFLTATTSGHFFNLRPDRVIGVIRASGERYFIVFFSFLIALGLYAWTVFGVTWIPESVNPPAPVTALLNFLEQTGFVPLLILGVYMMHAACFELGLLYRDRHDNFPWVLQRHISIRLMERVSSQPEDRAAAKAAREARRRARGMT